MAMCVHLEYCLSVVTILKDIKCIEKLQRMATKLVMEVYYMTYEERLSALHWRKE